MFYERKLCFYPALKKSIQLPYLIKSLSYGENVTSIKLLDNKNVVLKNNCLTDDIKNAELPMNTKFEDIICSGEYLYCINNDIITRYRVK